MESEPNSKFSSVNSFSQRGASRNFSQSQKNREVSLKRQQNQEQVEDGGLEGKGKKVDIKKLIEMKQARQLKQKGVQPKQKSQYERFFQKTNHPSIENCILCGYIVFTSDKKTKQSMKLTHMKKEHSEYSITKESISAAENNDQFLSIATELVKFAKNKQNKEQMEFILGQYEPEVFKPYVEYLPVSEDMKKLARIVQNVYQLNQ